MLNCSINAVLIKTIFVFYKKKKTDDKKNHSRAFLYQPFVLDEYFFSLYNKNKVHTKAWFVKHCITS